MPAASSPAATPTWRPLDASAARPWREAFTLALGIARALEDLHAAGVVHGDVAAQHVLVAAGAQVRLMAASSAQARWTHCAPECFHHDGPPADERADLYALGVTLYELLTGRLPFAADDLLGWAHAHAAASPPPLDPSVPARAEQLVLKLLAKDLDDRYQSARGAALDLAHAVAGEPFEPGQGDVPSHLRVRHDLVGRQVELSTLERALVDVVERGAPASVLITGEAGVGKSALIDALAELARARTARMIWAAGRADAHRRTEPYLVFSRALAAIADHLHGLADEDLAKVRRELDAALGDGADALCDIVPRLAPLVTPRPRAHPRAATTGAVETRARAHYLVTVFLEIAARTAPIVLVLDDLHVADEASLELLDNLARAPLRAPILYVLAARVTSTAPELASATLTLLRAHEPTELRLAALDQVELEALIADLFACAPEPAAALADLVFGKTLGNPFYALQLLHVAVDQGLIAFDRAAWAWGWDLDGLSRARPADNVAALLAGRVRRLSREAGALLATAACLGHDFDLGQLARLTGYTEAATRGLLAAAARAKLVAFRGASCGFVHERVRDAAAALLDPAERAARHLAIGHDLLASTPPEALATRAFEIAGHLGCGATTPFGDDERARIGRVFLAAAHAAHASGAFAAAMAYGDEGLALLGGTAWADEPLLTAELTRAVARSRWPTGDFVGSEQRFAELLARVDGRAERTRVLCDKIDMCIAKAEVTGGIAAALEGLRLFGMPVSLAPNEAALSSRYAALRARLDERKPESWGDLPLLVDPEPLALMELLKTLIGVAFVIDRSVRDQLALTIVELTLEHGLCEASPLGLAFFAAYLAERGGDITGAARWSRLARRLVERPCLGAARARTMAACVLVEGWTAPPREVLALARDGWRAALAGGDSIAACLNAVCVAFAGAARGAPLDELVVEIEPGLTRARQLGFDFARDTLQAARQWALALRGRTDHPSRLDGPGFDERAFLDAVAHRRIALATFNVQVFVLQVRTLGGDVAGAWSMASSLRALRAGAVVASPLMAWCGFFSALAAVAWADAGGDGVLARAVVREEEQHLARLAADAEGNFGSKRLIVAALAARMDGAVLEALGLFERAIARARASDFCHDEAIACELAADVAQAAALETAARAFRGAAHRAYARWGANGKLRKLEAAYPELAVGPHHALAELRGAAFETLATARATHLIATEDRPEALARLLLQVVLEYAGARHAHLVLARDGALDVASSFGVSVDSGNAGDDAAPALAPPLSILRHVFHAARALRFDAADESWAFAADPAFARRRPRSILCVPIARGAAPLGVLYVDNELVAGAFSATRVALVEQVAAQAAVALENARLAGALRQADERLRTLVRHAPVAIWATDAEGVVTFAGGRVLAALTERPDALVGQHTRAHFAHASWLGVAAEQALHGEAASASGRVGDGWVEVQAVPLVGAGGVVTGQTSIAVDVTARVRMAEDLRSLASALSSVEDAERRHLARDLHDSVAQALAAVKLELEALAARGGPPALVEVARRVREAHDQVRTVMFELYPTMLDDLGLGPTLRHYGRVLAGEGLQVSVHEAGAHAPLPSERAAFLFRAGKELLRNVMKHAGVTRALVTLSWREGAVRLAVADEGVGFDAARAPVTGIERGFGLFDLRQRVTHLGGRFRVESAPGAGTEVLIDLPTSDAAGQTATRLSRARGEEGP